MKHKYLGLSVWLTLFLVACQPQVVIRQVTEEVPVTRPILLESTVQVTRQVEVTRVATAEVTREVEVTRIVTPIATPDARPIPAPGSVERPFQLIFLPTAARQVVEIRGGLLVDAIADATGYNFEIVVPIDDVAARQLLCAQSQTAIAILTPEQYLIAQSECGVYLSQTALRFDVPFQTGMLVARTADAGLSFPADLSSKRIAVPSLDDPILYEWFASQVVASDVSEITFLAYGSSSAALLALLAGEVDLATAVYNPPILPREERLWEYGVDEPEVWRQANAAPQRNRVGYVDVVTAPEFGGYRIRDSRAALFDDYRQIFADTRIIALTAPFPNEAIVVGQDFPVSAVETIMAAMTTFTTSEACAQSVCASDFYQWTGLQPIADEEYDVWKQE